MTTPPVTLEEFRQHLNLSSDGSAATSELEMHLDGATELCEARIGPIVSETFTERVTATTGGALILTRRQVLSIESIKNLGGVTHNVSDLDIALGGVVRRLSGRFRGRYDVEYAAGWAESVDEAPAALKLAVMITASHLYETQRGRQASADIFGGAGEQFDTHSSTDHVQLIRSGYALPRRAIELLAAYEARPAIA